jgi:hypothetical protein
MNSEKTCMELATGNIRTPKGRLSYVYLLKPNPKAKTKDGELKYTATLLIPPGCDLTLMKNAAATAAREAFGETLKDKNGKPIALKSPFLDGEDKAGPDFKGWTVIRLTSVGKPGIVDATGKYVDDAENVYSGRWAYISVRAFAYDMELNKGVSFGMANVQLLDHDDPLAGRPKAETEFAPIEGADDATGIFN